MSDLDPRRLALERLRAEFDASFAEPPRRPRRDLIPLLTLRVGGDRAAVRALETAGLLEAKVIVPAPSRRPEVLGVCGVRGAVVPVFSLARLLGRAPGPDAPEWMLLAGHDERVALAFGGLEGHVLVPPSALRRAAAGAPGHVAEIVELGDAALPVVSIASLLRAIHGH